MIVHGSVMNVDTCFTKRFLKKPAAKTAGRGELPAPPSINLVLLQVLSLLSI